MFLTHSYGLVMGLVDCSNGLLYVMSLQFSARLNFRCL